MGISALVSMNVTELELLETVERAANGTPSGLDQLRAARARLQKDIQSSMQLRPGGGFLSRQLQMPTVVRSAGSPSQGHTGGERTQSGNVVASRSSSPNGSTDDTPLTALRSRELRVLSRAEGPFDLDLASPGIHPR